MPIRLTIGMEGDEQVNEVIFDMKNRVSNLLPAWKGIHLFLLGVFKKQFESQGARAASWAALSPSYAKWKTRQFPGKTILRRTDRLYNSFTVASDSEHFFKADTKSMVMGSTVEYAKKHQLGEGRVPRRRIISLTKRDRLTVRNIVRAHILGRVAGPVKESAFLK